MIEEDLCYFQNLAIIDLSDNRIRLEQLKNLRLISEINLQFNHISLIPPISAKDFTNLEKLNLSYNQINMQSIKSLYPLQRLKVLDLASNNLETVPLDMKQFESLEELNLSSNLMNSLSNSVNPNMLFKALG